MILSSDANIKKEILLISENNKLKQQLKDYENLKQEVKELKNRITFLEAKFLEFKKEKLLKSNGFDGIFQIEMLNNFLDCMTIFFNDKIDLQRIIDKKRSEPENYYKNIASYFLVYFCKLPLTRTGKILKRDHATIYYRVRNFEDSEYNYYYLKILEMYKEMIK